MEAIPRIWPWHTTEKDVHGYVTPCMKCQENILGALSHQVCCSRFVPRIDCGSAFLWILSQGYPPRARNPMSLSAPSSTECPKWRISPLRSWTPAGQFAELVIHRVRCLDGFPRSLVSEADVQSS